MAVKKILCCLLLSFPPHKPSPRRRRRETAFGPQTKSPICVLRRGQKPGRRGKPGRSAAPGPEPEQETNDAAPAQTPGSMGGTPGAKSGARNFPLDFDLQIRYNNVEDKPVCRNGRRGGLKIPCANHTCGFDPHHRHQMQARNPTDSGLFVLSAGSGRCARALSFSRRMANFTHSPSDLE